MWRIRVYIEAGQKNYGSSNNYSDSSHNNNNNNNNNNNDNNMYLLQLGCYPVAVVILHVYKI